MVAWSADEDTVGRVVTGAEGVAVSLASVCRGSTAAFKVGFSVVSTLDTGLDEIAGAAAGCEVKAGVSAPVAAAVLGAKVKAGTGGASTAPFWAACTASSGGRLSTTVGGVADGAGICEVVAGNSTLTVDCCGC
jgi:hypothetical protein